MKASNKQEQENFRTNILQRKADEIWDYCRGHGNSLESERNSHMVFLMIEQVTSVLTEKNKLLSSRLDAMVSEAKLTRSVVRDLRNEVKALEEKLAEKKSK